MFAGLREKDVRILSRSNGRIDCALQLLLVQYIAKNRIGEPSRLSPYCSPDHRSSRLELQLLLTALAPILDMAHGQEKPTPRYEYQVLRCDGSEFEEDFEDLNEADAWMSKHS